MLLPRYANKRGQKMNLKLLAATALIGLAAVSLGPPANAGHHNNNSVGAGLLGFGIGAVVGRALTPREVYVVPPPPPARAYYGPAAYVPPPWTPGWYDYCRSIHGPNFDPRSGYFLAADGGWYFCR